MVALKANAVEAFLARPDPAQFCILVYGPDAGLVAERAQHLAQSAVDDPADPFALVKLDGDVLASDPARLVDEALTIPMFSGRRAIWVQAGSRAFVAAVDALLNGPVPAARIVIEAGDLKKGAPLRALCEKHPRAAALPCYADNEQGIARLIESELGKANLRIDPQARAALMGLLGADRRASRAELDKLALYAHGQSTVTLQDVDAVVADSSALALDDVIDAAFAGKTTQCEEALTALTGAGLSPSAALAGALRHVLQLHRLRLEMEKGQRAAAVLEKGWPSLHFKRKSLVESALTRWPSTRLANALQRIADAIFAGRQAYDMSEVIAHRALISIAAEAERLR